MHPISPYITEELHAALHGQIEGASPDAGANAPYAPMIVETWPGGSFSTLERDIPLEEQFARLMDFVRTARNLRKTVGLADSKVIGEILFKTADEALIELIKESESDLAGLIKTERISTYIPDALPEGTINAVTPDNTTTVILGIDQSVDVASEIAKLEKDLENKRKYAETLKKKLNNPNFVDKAPQKVVDKETEKLRDAEKLMEDLEERLKKFQAL